MTSRILFTSSKSFEGCSPAQLGLLTYIIDAAAAKPGDTQTWTQKNITGTVFGLVDKFTGKTAADQARSQALQAQQIQAEQDVFAAEQRAATIQRIAPWAALGVGVLGVVIVLGVVAKSRKG